MPFYQIYKLWPLPETTLLFRSLKKELHLRRFPVYLLLDTSGSMHGEPIEAVKNGVQTLLTTLKQDPYALETAYVSVITFDSSARQAVPLTDLLSFQMPALTASGTTSLAKRFPSLPAPLPKKYRKRRLTLKVTGVPLYS